MFSEAPATNTMATLLADLGEVAGDVFTTIGTDVLPLSMNLCFCLRLVSCLSEAVSVSSDVCSPVADCKRPRPDGFSRAGAFPCLRGVFHGYAV